MTAQRTDGQYSIELPLSCPLLINGEEGPATGGGEFQRENPANARQVATVAAQGTLEDARAGIDAARRAFDGNVGNWLNNYKLREQVLFRTAQLMRENADRLAQVVSLEVGMPMRQAVPHIAAAADIFEFYAGLAGKIYGESFTLPNGSLINLVKEPVGVVGLITPWNFPLTQTARKVAPALAAGCTIVLKPASYTPAAAYELVKLMHQTDIPAGVLNLVPGPGTVVGSELVTNRDIDKLSFTGETGTGKMIAAQAATEVKRISLELGGKAPYLIFDDADVEAASRAAVFGMFRNAGQACGATTRLLLQEGIHDQVLERVTQLTRNIEVGNPAANSTDQGPLISASQERVVQGVHPVWPGRRFRPGNRRQQAAGRRLRQRLLRGTHYLRRSGQRFPLGPGGNLRSGGGGNHLSRRGRSRGTGQRSGLWPGGRCVERGLP